MAVAIISLVFSVPCFSQTKKNNCVVDFAPYAGLYLIKQNSLPKSMVQPRILPTANTQVSVSRIKGERILYGNTPGIPFINVKIETSDARLYKQDTLNLLKHLEYLASLKTTNKTGLLNMKLNGVVVYAYSSSSENARITDSYVCFPGKGLTVYIEYQNIPIKKTEYIKQRDLFLKKYTLNIANCRKSK
jgi:hypothetical protein